MLFLCSVFKFMSAKYNSQGNCMRWRKMQRALDSFMESTKLDYVKAATVQQRLVNQQLWPSRDFFGRSIGRLHGLKWNFRLYSLPSFNRLLLCHACSIKKLYVVLTYSPWAKKPTQLRMSYLLATREAGFGPSFEKCDCYYNHKNKSLKVQAQVLAFTNQ